MIGNVLCCSLLLLIFGVVVISVCIDGVLYEFSIIFGVKEDVIEIIFNIKQFVVLSECDEFIIVYLCKIGVGEVIVVDILVLVGVEVYNFEFVIVMFNDIVKFEFELMIECGCGYVLVMQNCNEYVEVGQILIDLIYLLVFKVSYCVDVICVGECIDFDKFVFDVEIKLVISFCDVVVLVVKMFIELFGFVCELNVEVEGIEIGLVLVEVVNFSELLMLIEDFDLLVCLYNCLKCEGINIVFEFVVLLEMQFMNICNFGQKLVDEVCDKFILFGLLFKDLVFGFDGVYFYGGSEDEFF